MGQALTQANRDHYLVALNRAVTEASEVDAWLQANPNAKLKAAEGDAPDIVMSPYFTKWMNFQAIRPAMVAFRDRLANADPAAWSSVTDDEHKTFGWVSVVDQIFAAWKADPKNMTAGRWVSGVRQPDPVQTSAGGASGTAVTTTEAPFTLLGITFPPTVLGMPTKTALIVGGLGVVGLGVALWAGFRK